MPTLRLGTASPATQATTAATLAQLSALAHRAAAQGIDLLLLPEAYIGGYPRGSAFGATVGGRTGAGRDEFLRYWRQAVDMGDIVGEAGAGGGDRWVRRELGHPSFSSSSSSSSPPPPPQQQQQQQQQQRDAADGGDEKASSSSAAGAATVGARRGDGTREALERIAAATGVFLVVGLVERAGGSLYCAATYVDPALGCVGKRRKVLPTGTERVVWSQAGPASLRAVAAVVRGVRLAMAAAICWESYVPLLRQALYAQNVNLYLAPTADARDAWLALMRTVGVEGRCFVVSANMCVREGGPGAWPADGPGGQEEQVSGGRGPQGPRRDSTILEDGEGVEIALPPPPSGTGGANGFDSARQPPSPNRARPRQRRKSVFDEDGNEIVLCCNDDDGVQEDGVAPDARVPPRKAATDRPTGKFVSRGGSCIVSPFGDVLAGPQWEDDEGIIWADVDFDDCIRGRLDLDVAGSYSRNDAFKFSVEGLDLDPLAY